MDPFPSLGVSGPIYTISVSWVLSLPTALAVCNSVSHREKAQSLAIWGKRGHLETLALMVGLTNQSGSRSHGFPLQGQRRFSDSTEAALFPFMFEVTPRDVTRRESLPSALGPTSALYPAPSPLEQIPRTQLFSSWSIYPEPCTLPSSCFLSSSRPSHFL